MKIATWNIERLKHKKQINTILSECESLGADILILTETNTSVKPDFKYFFQTELLQGITESVIYNDTESRVSIFTNYEIVKKYPTFDPHTSICIEVKTEKGNLVVYGTIAVTLTGFDEVLPDIASLREKKKALENEAKAVQEQIDTLILPIIDSMGDQTAATATVDGVQYDISYKPMDRTSINKDNLKRLKINSPDIYDEYVTTTTSRRLSFKCSKA